MAIMDSPATFLVGSLGCMALALHPNSSNAVSAYFAGCGVASAGYAMKRSYELQVEGAIANTMREYQVSSTAAEAEIRINQIYESAYPQQLPMMMSNTELDADKYFEWIRFVTESDKYPHAILEGETGGGKSTLATALVKYLGGVAIVSNPHYKPGDFPEFTNYCKGMNYGSWKQDTIPKHYLKDNESMELLFQDFLDDKLPFTVSCAHFFKIIHIEMKRRYKLREKGIEDYPFVNVIADELNETIDELRQSKSAKDDEWFKPTSKQCFVSILRQARKVNIRLIGLLQNAELEALDLKGMGSARKCFKRVRLGDIAKTYSKRIDPEVYAWCHTQEYPILVEDTPAKLPIPINAMALESVLVSNNESSSEESENQLKSTKDYQNHKDNVSEDNLEDEPDDFSDSSEDENQTNSPNKINLQKDNLPKLEQIEQEILAFCAMQKSVTSREVQIKFKKYKLNANTIKSILKDFAEKGIGSVTEKQVGGKTSFIFTTNDTSDVTPGTADVD
ncbi:MAG: ATP-binding protein [Okeania sp. SIO2D1]|nr:ATP-binding protein [Okeania sp. SIO2D1]